MTTVKLPAWARDFQRQAPFKFAYGGRGSGKSWTFARMVILRASSERLRVLCARELQLSITDSVHKLLSDQVAAMGLSHRYDIGRSYIREMRTGSEFVFKGLRTNAAEIKSMEGIGLTWVEEAQGVSADSWQLLIPTVMRTPNAEVWGTFNPATPSDYVWREWCERHRPDTIARKVNWRDNPDFPDELNRLRIHMRTTDPDRYAHVWDGGFRTVSDAQVLRGKWCVAEFEAGADWDGPYYGADWGFAQDPTALVRCWVHDRSLWIDHEAGGVGVDIHQLPQLFDSVPGARSSIIRGDCARPETISYMQQHGYPQTIAAPKWSGSVEDGVAHLRSYDRIVIHPRCIKTADEAAAWSYKVDRLSGDVMPVLIDKDNHYMDALRYALSPLIQGKAMRFEDWLTFGR